MKYICHVPIEVSYAMVCITMVMYASFAPYFKNLKILTLPDSNPFRFWYFPLLTLSNSDTFQFLPKMGKHWILTLSNPPIKTVLLAINNWRAAMEGLSDRTWLEDLVEEWLGLADQLLVQNALLGCKVNDAHRVQRSRVGQLEIPNT